MRLTRHGFTISAAWAHEVRVDSFFAWTDDSEIKKLFKSANKEEEWIRASTRTKSGSLWVLAAFGVSSKQQQHIHIDVAKREFFGKPGLPGKSTTIANIRKMLADLTGKQLTVDIEGQYVVPLDDAPALIRGSRFELTSQNVLIKTRAVSMSVKDGPIYSISWRQNDDSDITIVIEARTTVTVDDSYFLNGFTLIEAAYKKYVTGGTDE